LAASKDTLSSRKISKDLTHALNQAAGLMQSLGHQDIMTAEVLLLAFIKTPDVEAHQLLRRFSQQRGFAWPDFEREVERIVSDQRWSRRIRSAKFYFLTNDQQRVALNSELLIVLDEGLGLAEARGDSQCNSADALTVMTQIRVGTHWPLTKRGITHRAVLDALDKSAPAVSSPAPAKDAAPDSIYIRAELLDKLVNLLSMTRQRHVILVGPAGVGKRSLVLSLAKFMAQGKRPGGLKAVVQLDERALLDNPLAAVQSRVEQARQGVLFVPDLARFFGGLRADFREDVCNELQKAFYIDDVVIIGTATEARFSEKLSKATVISERCQILKVPPTTVDETSEILNALRPTFEADYGLKIADKSLVEAARLAGRYYTAEPLPEAAVHLLHRACAKIRMSVHDGEKAATKGDNRVDPDDIMVATSLLTGIPVSKMGADERNRYVNMVEHLHKRIIGQDAAVLALSRAVKMARVGLKDPKRPIGSFLFLGPTGVGKSELAKALAEFMFNTENALITLDMSEYMDDSSVNRLIGSPPGYVGHEAGGQLTDAVKKQPYSVVLFDEVEKASVKVFDVLLQVMDEGRMTSGQGELVSFSECVILMTSNIGSRHLADLELSEPEAHELAETELKEHFRPEFLNRLDDIIFFHLLTDENLRDIMALLLRQENKLLANRDLKLELTGAAKTWLLAQNDHPEWGARPLRRIIQTHLREPLADLLLKEDIKPGAVIKVRIKNQELLLEMS
jgi:ATP-dependent Clp protease ATP-binding subunit ClpC